MTPLLINKKTFENLAMNMPNANASESMAELFFALSDRTRVKILAALAMSEMCVTDLSLLTDVNQTTLSHQLAALKRAKLVKRKQQGKVVFYSVGSDKVLELFNLAVDILYG